MQTLEVFFDYTCPFCFKGHRFLKEIMGQFEDIVIEWHPCEAHPRPEHYGMHSDLCARGMFFAQDNGADLMEYHRIMFRAAVVGRVNIEDMRVIAELGEGLLDTERFYQALSNGMYEDRLLENNRLAWDVYEFAALPSYRMNGELLKSIEGVGTTKERLVEFCENNQIATIL